MSTTDVNDFLMGGGIAAAKFPEIGTVVKGTIVNTEVVQQTDYATGEPKVWSDGKPMMQAVFTLQTDERDAEIDGDTGMRKLYVKGAMQQAVRDAVKQAGASKIEVGGIIAVQYVADKASEKRGFNPAKQFKAQYKQPAAGVDATNDLLNASSTETASQNGVAAADLI